MFLAAAFFLQLAQVPKLGPVQAVDVRVARVNWRPRGDALLYARAGGQGEEIGAFCPGDPEGRVVLPLPKGARWRCDWFEVAAQNLVTVTVPDPAAGKKRLSVYFVDARTKAVRELFARTVDMGASLDLDLSPSLIHAIARLRDGEVTTHFVVPIGGGNLLAAGDLDRAEAEGLAGPSWSRNGTAIYAAPSGEGYRAIIGSEAISGLKLDQGGSSATFHVSLRVVQGGGTLSLTDGETFDLRILPPPAPEPGVPVFEVIPHNGVLRRVKSPGPWEAAEAVPTDRAAQTAAVRLETDDIQARSNGVTLTGGPADRLWRLMVAPKAEWANLAPSGNALAYAIDGALFVRQVRGGR